MRIALNSFTEKPIWAEEITRPRYGDLFVCPYCRQDVMFIGKGSKEAYFRHWPNVADETCVEYVGAHTTKANGFILQDHLEQARVIIFGMAMEYGSLGLRCFPHARFAPREGDVSISFGGVPFPSTFPNPRFVPLDSIDREYTVSIINDYSSRRVLELPGYCREILVFKTALGFWALLDDKACLESDEYFVMARNDLATDETPEGLHLEMLGCSFNFFCYRLTLLDEISDKVEQYCWDVFGYAIRRKVFNCSILTESLFEYHGSGSWGAEQSTNIVLFLRSNRRLPWPVELSLDSFIGSDRKRETVLLPARDCIIEIGELPIGRHVLSCETAQEVIIGFDIRNGVGTKSIQAVQLNFRTSEESCNLWWDSIVLADVLMEHRKGKNELTHLLLPHGFNLEIHSHLTNRTKRIFTADELSSEIKSTPLPSSLRVCSVGGEVRGFAPLFLEPREASQKRKKTLNAFLPAHCPTTPLSASIRDAFARGRACSYSLSANGRGR